MNLSFILKGSKVSLPAESISVTGLDSCTLHLILCDNADQGTTAAKTYHDTLNELNLARQQVTQQKWGYFTKCNSEGVPQKYQLFSLIHC